ncbi:hypothetical protein C8Q74DRAFT_731476 [Fomes fomentarius]|nr:hypothetical protein C8Q74DRAFT_731476 [Fomes fomentarius]
MYRLVDVVLATDLATPLCTFSPLLVVCGRSALGVCPTCLAFEETQFISFAPRREGRSFLDVMVPFVLWPLSPFARS